MQSKIFAKVFNDLKKQSESQKQKPLPHKKPQTFQAVSDPSDPSSQEKVGRMIKKISKESREGKQAMIKKWKNDLYNKLSRNKEHLGKKERTLLVENGNQQDIIGVLGSFKIHIQEIRAGEVVFDCGNVAQQCLGVLRSAGWKAKKASEEDVNEGQPKQAEKAEEKPTSRIGSIFQRIK